MRVIILLCCILLFKLNSRSSINSIKIRFSIDRKISARNSLSAWQLPHMAEEDYNLENNKASKPSSQPTSQPTGQPSIEPTSLPTLQPSLPKPSDMPLTNHSTTPTTAPSIEAPATPSIAPSTLPLTVIPTIPISLPPITTSSSPSFVPSFTRTTLVSTPPSTRLSVAPSIAPRFLPSIVPSNLPSTVPILSLPPSVEPSTLQPTQSLPNSEAFIQVSQPIDHVNASIASTLPAQTAIRNGISRALKLCVDCVVITSVSANSKQQQRGPIRMLATTFTPGILVNFTLFFDPSSITLNSLIAEIQRTATSGALMASIKAAAVALNISTLADITVTSVPFISGIITYAPSATPFNQQLSTISLSIELLAVTISLVTFFGCCILIVVAVYLRQRRTKRDVSGANIFYPGSNEFDYNNERIYKSESTLTYDRTTETQPRQSFVSTDSADPGAVDTLTNPMHRSRNTQRINTSGRWSLFNRNSIGFGVDASKFVDDYILSSVYEPQSDTSKGTELQSQSSGSSRITRDSNRGHGRSSGTPMNLSLSSSQEYSDSRYPVNRLYTADRPNSIFW